MATKKDIRLGKNVKRLRKKAGLTQDGLAEKVGVSTKYIQFIESAQRIPSLKTVYKIAQVLKVKTPDLFS